MPIEALFLSDEELADLTGFRTPSKQVEWLRRKGWRFEQNGNRKAIVSRRYTEKMLGFNAEQEQQRVIPNFAALRAV